MTITFDRVLEELVRICETGTYMPQIQKLLVVRDLAGCVRLVVRPRDGEVIEVDGMEKSIIGVLGQYFKKPLLSTDSQRFDERRLAKELLNVGAKWTPSYIDPSTLDRIEGDPEKWSKLERRISKQEWLEGGAPAMKPPWDLGADKPAIVTFFSFKGGVGRSTDLISCAWQLAESGKRVCVIDLDLEAPGLGALLKVKTNRGVLDFLVDFLATGKPDLNGCHAAASVMDDESASRVDVIPAGNIDLMYLEKLARLDFVGTQMFESAKSPVQKGMEALLGKVSGELKPDYILLDSRAGLHDMAGLSLHGLAHVDVIVARASEQSYDGLDVTVHALGLRKDPTELLTVVVHAFAPPDEHSPEGQEERISFRGQVYDSFVQHIYDKLDDDDPQEEDTTAPHSPMVVSQNQYLERFSSLSAPKTKEALFGGEFVRLRNRIEELCKVSDTEDDAS